MHLIQHAAHGFTAIGQFTLLYAIPRMPLALLFPFSPISARPLMRHYPPLHAFPSTPLYVVLFGERAVLGKRLQTTRVSGVLCQSSVHVCGYFGLHSAVGEALQEGHGRVGHLGAGTSLTRHLAPVPPYVQAFQSLKKLPINRRA